MWSIKTDDVVQKGAGRVIACWIELLAECLALQKSQRRFRGNPERWPKKFCVYFKARHMFQYFA
jgi:hypothetical protein